jgi:hypothetical protein
MSRASIETYQKITYDGTLSERRWQVYSALWKHEEERPDLGLTHNEISKLVLSMYTFPDGYRNNTVARLCELEKQGVVRRVGELTCPVSKELCTTWKTCDSLPKQVTREHKRRFFIVVYPEELRKKGYVYRVKAKAEAAHAVCPNSTLIEVEEVVTRKRSQPTR